MTATEPGLVSKARSPSGSTGSVRAMAAAAIRIKLNVPIRLMSMTLRKDARSCGVPSRPTVRDAQPIPAQFTTTRSGASWATAASTAAATDPSSDTSVFTNRPPNSAATAFPCCSFRSATTTVAPALASARAAASPRPLAPPEMIAAVPFSFMGGAYLAAADANRTGFGRAGWGRARGGPTLCPYPRLPSVSVGPPPGAPCMRFPQRAWHLLGWQGERGEESPGKPLGGADRRLARVLHDPAGPDDREYRDPQHDYEAARVARRRPVGDQRLRPRARRAGHHGRPAWRPSRAADNVRLGHRPVHGGLGRLRPGPEPGLADRVPCRPGSRRGHAHAADADDHHEYLPAGTAGCGVRRLGRRGGSSDDCRADPGRPA